MLVSRRSFLVGAGSIITSAFVNDAIEFTSNTKALTSARHVAWRVDAPYYGKVIFYEPVEDHWRLHWGQPQFEIPEPQLLIDNLRYHGHVLDTQIQIDAFCAETGWTEKDLLSPMDDFAWQDQWEHYLSTEAKAFTFLEKYDIFSTCSLGRREGQVTFQSYPNPMSNARWVEVHDYLSLTLLQARLDELQLGPVVRPHN